MSLVLWDVDGTLVRTGPVSRDAFEAAFAVCLAEGVDADLVTEVAAGVLARLPDELRARSARLVREGVVLPHVRTTLSALAALGVRSGVVTGNLQATARLKLGHLGLADDLDLAAAAYGDDGPDRDALVPVALSRAGAAAEDAWVVGDTPHDLTCARAAGVRCLLVATGSYALAELAALRPDAVLPDLADAVGLLAA
jgi:phosphoglycolate phosphatase